VRPGAPEPAGAPWSGSPARWPAGLLFAVVAGGYTAGTLSAFAWFGALGIGLPVFFPSAGLTLGVLVACGRRRWPVVLGAAAAAEFTVDVVQGLGIAAATGFAIANVAEPAAGAALLLLIGRGRIDLSRREHLALFVGGAVVAAPLLGAVLGATADVLFARPVVWAESAARWWIGDGLGVLVVGGLILACLSGDAVRLVRARLVEAAALVAVTWAALAAALWGHALPLLYGVALLFVWIAFRIGVLGVTVAGTGVAFLIAAAIASDGSLLPLLGFAPAVSLVYVQSLIALLIVTMLALAVEVGEREHAVLRFTAAEAARRAADVAAAAERQEHRHSHLLARLSAALSDAATIEEAIAALHESGLEPVGASGSSVGLLAPDGSIRLVIRGFPGETAQRYRTLPPDAALPGPATARDGTPRYFSTVEEATTLFPGVADVLAGTGYVAAAVLPLRRAGTTIGFIGAHFVGQHDFDRADRALLEAMAGQVGHAIERARLYETAVELGELAERRSARERLRNDVSTRMTAAVDERGEVQGLLDALVPAMADFATVEVPDGRGSTRVLAVAHTDPGKLDTLRLVRERHALGPDDANAVARTIATGESQFIERIDRATIQEYDPDPEAKALLGVLGPCSYLCVPLATHGSVLGALLLCHAESGRHYAPEDLTFLQGVATEAALRMDNSRLQHTEHRIAEVLQRSLLPPTPPVLPALAMAVRYLPAAVGTRAGGDWYDLIELDDRDVAIVVGDVVGHGPSAAAVMGQLRSALAAYLGEGHGPAEALTRLSRFARRVEGARGSTATCLVLDTVTGWLRWAHAGHPPPLVIGPGGAAYLGDATGTLLGVTDPPPYTEGRTTLGAGSSILLYTDGLVERRGEVIDEGLDRLLVAASRFTGGPEGLLDHVHATLVAATEPSDDIAMIVARLLPPPLQRRMPATPEQLRPLRVALRAWSDAHPLPDDMRDDLLLAVNEAVSNSAEHAYPPAAPGDVEYTVTRDDGGGVQVRVRDFGRWRAEPEDNHPRGRGIALIRGVATDVVLEGEDSGTTVRFRLGP
jgi:GAF domain-containing protein/integral membrane sensor domain MASE1/anti-sigma regulatory factor (Ser/Thr protein kinase)